MDIIQRNETRARGLSGTTNDSGGPKTYCKRFVVTAPDGQVFRVTNLSAFCRAHGLHKQSMLVVLDGHWSHHHGWRATRAERE